MNDREKEILMDEKRTCGILLHPTSLPGKFGIGDIGPQAYRFVDFMVETGQSHWQILPLGHTGYGNSPYMCLSTFGGNPYLISLEKLVDDGLLDVADIDNPPDFPRNRVDYGQAISYKMPLLAKSLEKFKEKSSTKYPDDFYIFSETNAFWLEDYALFMSLKEAHDGRVWTEWEEGAANRDLDALVQWRNRLADNIQFWKYLQYIFFEQWLALKTYCHAKGIRIIGDVPVYVAHDSAEVWAHRKQFHLDEQG